MKQVDMEEKEEEETPGPPPLFRDVTSVPGISLLIPGPNSATLGTKPLTHGSQRGDDLRSGLSHLVRHR